MGNFVAMYMINQLIPGLNINTTGSKFWIYKNQFHRINGPAVINNGSKFWMQNGLNHRLNGPAIYLYGGKELWYYYGKEIDCNNQEDFDKIINLKILW